MFLAILSTHHTRPRKHGIVDGVGTNEAVTVNEFDFYHNEIVNMLEVFTEGLFRMVGITPADDEIATDTKPNFVSDMTGKGEVPVSPSDFNLGIINNVERRKRS